jgi:hypothetical protein
MAFFWWKGSKIKPSLLNNLLSSKNKNPALMNNTLSTDLWKNSVTAKILKEKKKMMEVTFSKKLNLIHIHFNLMKISEWGKLKKKKFHIQK